MELVNRTPLPAELVVSELGDRPLRAGLLVAKATFLLEGGRALLDTQDPMPVLGADEAHPLGVLPADVAPRDPSRFEVALLGHARPPGGRPARRMAVSLAVGQERRELAVFGDRVWRSNGQPPEPSEPEPFEAMPLVWERAYGGSAEVEVDEGSFVRVSEPRNPLGRGLDVGALARDLAATLGCPPGYPRWEGPRALPNLEAPGALVRAPGDSPAPSCWAPLPAGAGMALRALEAESRGELASLETNAVAWALERVAPAWSIGRPAARAAVVLEGCSPDGPIAFGLPELRVFADHVVGARRGSRELAPVRMLLFPEERRMTLLYESRFQVEYDPQLERGLRLRIEEEGA